MDDDTDDQAILPPGSKCSCGNEMPWHLIKLAVKGFKHICSCGRVYVPVEGGAVPAGVEKNPFVETP